MRLPAGHWPGAKAIKGNRMATLVSHKNSQHLHLQRQKLKRHARPRGVAKGRPRYPTKAKTPLIQKDSGVQVKTVQSDSGVQPHMDSGVRHTPYSYTLKNLSIQGVSYRGEAPRFYGHPAFELK